MTGPVSESQRLVQGFQDEARSYWRQFHMWLGIGSAGGAISIVSLAANLPDPSYSFKFFVLSFWFFLLGAMASSGALICLAKCAMAKAAHFSYAHNREQYKEAINATPEVIAAPQSLADEMNAGRNQNISEYDKCHHRAESAWRWQFFWSRMWALCLLVSGMAFVVGFAWPVWKISFQGLSPVG